MKRISTLFALAMMAVAPAMAHGARDQAFIIGGDGSDPGMVWGDLAGLVDQIAADHQVPDGLRDDFKSKIRVAYHRDQREDRGVTLSRFAGRLTLPTCKSSVVYAFQMEGRDDDSSRGDLMGEVLGEQIELALVDYATSCNTP